MNKNPQDQTSGDHSVNVQSGRDLNIYGPSVTEMREIALDVYRSNSIELAGVAQSLAVSRAGEMTKEFLDKLEKENPQLSTSFADPDFQSGLFEAQKAYACSGEEDLKSDLIEILTQRAGATERDLRTLALNEAIIAAPKLTEQQRRAIAWIFYLQNVAYTGELCVSGFYSALDKVASALGVQIPTKGVEYQHMEYVGVASSSFLEFGFGHMMQNAAEGVFTYGFLPEEVDFDLFNHLKTADLITTGIREPSRFQLKVFSLPQLPDRLRAAGLHEHLDAIEAVFKKDLMGYDAVANDVVEKLPSLAPLRNIWDSQASGIRNLKLTSVGIALGYTYWSRLTGLQGPLSIWL